MIMIWSIFTDMLILQKQHSRVRWKCTHIARKKSMAMSMYTLTVMNMTTSTLIVTKKNIHMDTHTAMRRNLIMSMSILTITNMNILIVRKTMRMSTPTVMKVSIPMPTVTTIITSTAA